MKRRLAIWLHGRALKLEPMIAAVIEAHIQLRIQAGIEEYERQLIAAHREHAERVARNN